MALRSFVKFPAVAATALVLLSCSPIVETRGNMIDDRRLNQINVGQTTRDDAAFILGTPSATAPFQEDEAWFYIGQVAETRAFFEPQIVERQVVALTFDQQGFVSAVERLNLEDGENVDLVNRETPTRGREMSIMEQLLGNLGQRLGQSMD
ncbi:outer membrane protein assembly factor BamE [Fodinicurvata sp. EGI_FJ10296]|uniref:outer membrane protein assembly factor BamE n=1 Tax=Fodinicurvata sp. EGI_FJ10296 TaxID=3231908 RepID=UPI003454B78D